jgi:cytochrome oxidase assembly protein ShyY1
VPHSVLNRRILAAVAGAIGLAIVCYFLARWQLSRFEEKDVRANAVEGNYTRDAVPLTSVLAGVGTPLREDQVWTRVTATGRYAAGPPLYVRNRALNSAAGMEILVPFVVDSGGTLLVDRGWAPNGTTAADLPVVPAAPSGTVTITGWLKPSEDSAGKDLPIGQLATVNVADAQAQLGTPLYAAYLVLADERVSGSSEVPPRPTPLEVPTPDRGPHVAYAIQWVLVALLGAGFVVTLYRAQPAQATAREAARGSRPKRVRIWDEEDG